MMAVIFIECVLSIVYCEGHYLTLKGMRKNKTVIATLFMLAYLVWFAHLLVPHSHIDISGKPRSSHFNLRDVVAFGR